jgi:CspA family cold shock protein
MPIGTLKRFNADRGFGFIAPDSEVGPECFVHVSILARAGIKNAKPGDPLIYEIGERGGKPCAVSVEALKAWQVEDEDDSED